MRAYCDRQKNFTAYSVRKNFSFLFSNEKFVIKDFFKNRIFTYYMIYCDKYDNY